MRENVRQLGRKFDLEGDFQSYKAYGSGHINDTILVEYRDEEVENSETKRYLHQRVNHHVFKEPHKVMDNIDLVTEHQRSIMRAEEVDDLGRKALSLVRTKEGKTWCQDADGYFWRTYDFIEGAESYDFVSTPKQAYEAAKAFGEFQRMLLNIDPSTVHETIRDFHNTPKRVEQLAQAIHQDPFNRIRRCKPELAQAMEYSPLAPKLLDLNRRGEIPLRVIHNDTKINNVLFDKQTGEAICVIDLDTVMPGLSLYDFGDMVRTATCPADEDEQDLSKVYIDEKLFEAVVEGYWTYAKDFLTQAEVDHLVLSGMIITYELATRFLADYLLGDIYFKVHRERHNLERARTQFRLVQSMMEKKDTLEAIVKKVTA